MDRGEGFASRVGGVDVRLAVLLLTCLYCLHSLLSPCLTPPCPEMIAQLSHLPMRTLILILIIA